MPPLVTLVPMLFVIAGWAGYACAPGDAPTGAAPPAIAAVGRQMMGLGPAPPVNAAPEVVPLPVVLGPPGGPSGSVNHLDGTQVALIFDDGPDPVLTPRLLDLLAASGAKATFCLIGKRAAAHPGIVARIAAEGHTLCNHSWSHQMGLGRQSEGDIARELRDTTAAIQAAAPGAPVRYFRAPGGYFTERLVAVAGSLGMLSLHWTFDTQDWNYGTFPRGPTMLNHLLGALEQGTRPGSIILSHDAGRPDTITAYERLLPALRERYVFVALPI
jgi:peptidoglycan/xylan/chitin deacetylase (PgdA/CDA1 family)